jgi:hypothetical protein
MRYVAVRGGRLGRIIPATVDSNHVEGMACMFFMRPLIVLAFAAIALALPVAVAHGGSQWPADSSVDERPPDLPP